MTNKFKRLLQTALSLTLLMLFCACSKDDGPVPAAPAAEEQFLLTGTVWESTNDYHEPIFGEDLVFENRYEFTTDSSGTVRQILKSTYGVDTSWFTLRYTWDGKSTGQAWPTNSQGQELSEATMEYNPQEQTLVIGGANYLFDKICYRTN